MAVLKQAVGPRVGGADRPAFDVLNGRMTVAEDARVPEDEILKAVAATGLSAVPWVAQVGAAMGDHDHRRQQALFTAASVACVLISLTLNVRARLRFRRGVETARHARRPAAAVAIAAYAAAVLWGRGSSPWYAARSLRPDMNLLMTVAVVGATAIGEWFEAATVSFLFALSLAIESWSVGRARRAISELLDLAPPTARLLRPDGSETEAPVAEVGPVAASLCRRGNASRSMDGLWPA